MKSNYLHKESNSKIESTILKTRQQINYEWISELSHDFNVQVQKPINMREAFLRQSENQKCLRHGITFSVYCTLCRKVLCASCMYSTLVHRKHRVIPIQNSMEQIKEDIRALEEKIPKISYHVCSLINSNSTLLMKVQKNLNPIHAQITKFYEHLRQYLIQKEKEQLHRLKQIKDSIKNQILTYNDQLNRINSFITDKYKQYSEQTNKDQMLIASRNIFQILTYSQQFIFKNKLNSEKISFPTTQQRIKQINQKIQASIDSIVKTFIPESQGLIQPRGRTNSQTQIKRGLDKLQRRSHSVTKTSLFQEGREKRRNSTIMAMNNSHKF